MRLLSETDRSVIKNLCKHAPEFNIFFLASLNTISSNKDLIQYWGQFDSSGGLIGILLRYNNLWYIYDTPGCDLIGFANVIEALAQPRIVLNDNVRTAPSLIPLLANYQVERSYPARLRRLNPEHFSDPIASHSTRKATDKDIERLSKFYAHAPADVRRGPDSIRRSIGKGRRTFLVEMNDEIVASALTTAELPEIAMIGGLHTPKHLRDQDFLLTAVAMLTRSLIDEGKRPCVVTRDPLINSICERLGYEDLGAWSIVHAIHCSINNRDE